LQFTHYHGKKYMYIPPIYDHGHCGSLVHGGFLFRDFPPMLLIFHFHFTGVIIFYHDCEEIPRVLGNRSGRDRILVEYTCTFYRGSV
jgi:hypothetical protein